MKLQIDLSLTARHLGKPKTGIASARIIRDGKPVVAGICLHDTAGSGSHNDTKYLANPSDGRSVSVDFTVERDGSVFQLNPDLKRYFTYHAGRATSFRAQDGRTYRNADCNRVLIGIELVQKARMDLTPAWPAAQVQAAAELCVFLCQTFSIGKESITTHAKIITDGSRSDPRGFPFSTFWFEFNKAATVPTPEPAGGLGSPTIHTVVSGDTLSGLAKRYATTIESIKALNNINASSNLIRIGQILTIRR
jgi:N-acetyl-anhydromuramyl-L-alanine amidase AmpD